MAQGRERLMLTVGGDIEYETKKMLRGEDKVIDGGERKSELGKETSH